VGQAGGAALPALFAPKAQNAEQVMEFFAARIRNPNTRKAYARATDDYAA
jgi:hypothetical protein